MTGPLINPGDGERGMETVDDAGSFHRRMARYAAKHGRPPKIRVLIQVRGHVVPIQAYRARLGRAIGRMKERGVPRDERGPLLERVMQETDPDSREWETVEVYWEGRYDRRKVELPSAAKLKQVEEKLGAAEAKVAVRADI